MSDFITLTCPSCGGRLEITKDVERFACAHCGNEHVVKRAGGVISLAPVMEGLQKVQASTDRVAAELAIQRLNSDLAAADEAARAANVRLEAASKALALGPSVVPAALLAAVGLFGTFICGAIVLLAFASKADPGTLLPFFLGALVITAALLGLFFLRQSQSGRLKKSRDVARGELATAQQRRQAIIQERDRKRAAAGL